MSINLNTLPYHNDYKSTDGFLKVLFKPGYAIQGRELIEIQSILQNQISSLSDHLFKDGSIVIPGQSSVDVNVDYIKIRSTGIEGGTETYNTVYDFLGRILVKTPLEGYPTSDDGIMAKVIHVEQGIEGDDRYVDTLFLKYIAGSTLINNGDCKNDVGSPAVTSLGSPLYPTQGQCESQLGHTWNALSIDFVNEYNHTSVLDTILEYEVDKNGVETEVPKSNFQCEIMEEGVYSKGKSSLAHIDAGIYYINGNMVAVHEQTISLDWYSNRPTYKIGLRVKEEIVTVYDDSSLYDNAQGSPNFNAPGADRYKVSLVFEKVDYNLNTSDDFIQLISINDGQIERILNRTDYALISEIMALRTYEQSGNFTVKSFSLDIREYFDEFDNNGVKTIEDIAFRTNLAAMEFVETYFKHTDMYDDLNEVGYVHNVTIPDTELFPEQNLIVSGEVFYPGKTHSQMMRIFRDHLAVGMENGIAYVKGNRITSNTTVFIPYKRATEAIQRNSAYLTYNSGKYIYVSDINGLPRINSSINLFNTMIIGKISKFGIRRLADDTNGVQEITDMKSDDNTITNGNLYNWRNLTLHDASYDPDDNSQNINTYRVDIVGTARIKSVEFVQGNQSGIINNGMGVDGSNISTPTGDTKTSGIFKICIYDLQYNDRYGSTGSKYNASDIRSMGGSNIDGSANTIESSWSFCANVLHEYKLSSTGVGSVTVKPTSAKTMVFAAHEGNTKTRGIVYQQVGTTILVKHTGSSLYEDTTTVSNSTFKSGGYILSVVYNSGLGGTFDIENTALLETLNGGRILSATTVHDDGGSGLVDFETPFIKTVRHVDDVSGSTTIDTSYTYQQEYINQSTTSDDGVVYQIKIILPATSFDRFMPYNSSMVMVYTSGTTSTTGQCHVVESAGYIVSSDSTELTIKSDTFTATGLYNVILPLIKTEAIEKTKTKRIGQVYLPFTFVKKDGDSVSPPTQYYELITEPVATVVSASYGVDLYSSDPSDGNPSYITDNTLIDASGNRITMEHVQLKHSDVVKTTIYDTSTEVSLDGSNNTVQVINIVYRVDLDGTMMFIHNMTAEHFKFAADAWAYFERVGMAPWEENLQTTNVTDNPFFEDMTSRYEQNGNMYDNSGTVAWDNTAAADGNGIITGTERQLFSIYDVSDNYTLDGGQRDGLIDIATVSVKRGRSPVKGRMVVIYDYYSHGVGDYATVDSYINTDYDEIPEYKGIRLSGYMDFRPASTFTKISNSILAKGSVFDHTGGIKYPLNRSSIITDYRLYLRRRDKIYLTGDGMFNIQYGNASVRPSYPTNFVDGMLLYKLEATEYTSSAKDVDYIAVDNQLYKMDDIRKLETRISNLEYYTSLSLLEKETSDMTITDANGNNRFKNGFLVEPFLGHNIGDIKDVNYQCSIDYAGGVLRPKFSESNVNFELNVPDSSHYTIKDGLIMLPYGEEKIITQPKSSKTVNVNPYAVFTFRGGVVLNPPNDNWRDVNRSPDVTIKRDEYAQFAATVEQSGVLGTKWGEIIDSWTTRESSGQVGPTQTEQIRGAGNGGWGIRRITFQDTYEAVTEHERQSGVITSLQENIKTERLGDKVIDTTIVPFIRSRPIMFKADAMKPNTKLYAFFDGKNVTEYCSTATSIVMNNLSNTYSSTTEFVNDTIINNKIKNNVRLVLQGASSNYRTRILGLIYSSATDVEFIVIDNIPQSNTEYIVGEDLMIVSIGGDFSSQNVGKYSYKKGSISSLTTSNAGELVGFFEIPNTDSIRFRCGSRDFRLTDQKNNSSDAGTSAESTYSASGIISNVQDTIVQTRTAQIVKTNTTRDTSTTDTVYSGRVTIADTGWYDPLAQTIEVKPDNGMFVSSVDLFFSTKPVDTAPQIPVRLQIRDTVAGFPGQTLLGNQCVVSADKINISDDGSVATNFRFDYPVHLKHGKEYCIVILADTQDYRCHVSRLGEESLDGTGVISKQPYAGVFFKSQNASTWTADQMEDLKFSIYRAKFDITKPGKLLFNNTFSDINGYDINSVMLGELSVELTPNSSMVTFHVNNHHLVSEVYKSRSLVAITGIRSDSRYGGDNDAVSILGSHLNGVHTVVSTTLDTFTIDISREKYNWYHPDDGTISGMIRGNKVSGTGVTPINGGLFTPQSEHGYDKARVYINLTYDIMYPSITDLIFNNTSLSYSIKTTSGTSQHSTNLPGIPDSVFSPIIPDGGGISFDTTRTSFSYENEYFFGNNPSLELVSTLSSNNDYLSPIIDYKRCSAILQSNRVNYPDWNVDPVTLDEIGHDTFSWNYVANNGFVSELESSGGSCDCRYITKEVVLNDASSSLKITISVYKPFGSDVAVYYKTKTTDTVEYRSLKYIRVPNTREYNDMVSVSENEWFEFEFDVNDIDDFISFGVKLVLRANNSSSIPMVKDLRVIATA